MTKTKKIFCAISLACLVSFAFADEVTSLLDAAKSEYASGNLENAIQKIEDAKRMIEKKKLASNETEYIEVKSWDVVELKADSYVGKKIKLYDVFYGVIDGNNINVGVRGCTFEKNLIDKILELTVLEKYTFYGTVKKKSYGGLYLHIEAISN